jgi:hypothetical protein
MATKKPMAMDSTISGKLSPPAIPITVSQGFHCDKTIKVDVKSKAA